MKALTAIGSALLLLIGAAAHAEENPPPEAAEKPAALLCAPTIVLECRPDGTCPSTTPADADVPSFVKVDAERKEITTLDGKRTSPIKRVDHLSDRLVLQGGEEENAWTVVVSEATGDMSATASGADHTFVIFGACTAFPGSAP
jgi:hypothetical protein